MSTIKINELATTDISLTDFFAKADANGFTSKNSIQNLATLISTTGDIAFKGGLSIADTPVEGWYFAEETGNYVIGGTTIPVDITNTLTIIIVPDVLANSYKVEIPLGYTVADEIEEGNPNLAVSGDVFKHRYKQYPFTDEMYSVLDDGFNIASIFNLTEISFINGGTKYLSDGEELKNFYLKGFGTSDDGLNYFLEIGRQKDDGSYTSNTLEVLISNVTDQTNVKFELVLTTLKETFLCNFLYAKHYNETNLSYNDKTDFSPLVIKEVRTIPTTTDEVSFGNDDPVKSDSVFKFRYKQYPFKSEINALLNTGYNMADIFKRFDINFINGASKFKTNGEIKNFYVKGFGTRADGITYFLEVGRQKNDGSYNFDTMEVLISDVTDETAIYFEKLNSTLEIKAVCDFTVAKTFNLTGFTPNNRTDIDQKLIKENSDISKFNFQVTPATSGQGYSETLMKDYRNELDGTKDIYNGSYSWWCRPHSFMVDGVDYLNYIAKRGAQVTYDDSNEIITSVSTEKKYDSDEHNTASAYKMSNGEWIYAYTGHQDDGVLRVRTGIEDLKNNNSKEIELYVGGSITYAQIAEYNGNVIIATRTNLSGWYFQYSTDYGINWKNYNFLQQDLTDFNQMYICLQMTGTKFVKIYQYFHPNEGDVNRISYGVIDLETLKVYDKEGGTEIADINNSPCIVDDLKVLHTALSGHNLRLLDVSGDSTTEAIFTIADIDVNNSNLGNYKVVEYDLSTSTSTVTTITAHGGYFTGEYVGGAYIRQGLQGETDNSALIIYTSKKDGSTWKIEKWQVSAGVSFLVGLLDSSTEILARPIPPLGSLGNYTGVQIFYIKGEYFDNSFHDWRTVIKKIYY